MMPAVIFCDYLPKKSPEVLAVPNMEFNLGTSPFDLSAMLKTANIPAGTVPLHVTMRTRKKRTSQIL